jgi:hypothetical protein
MTRPKPPSLQDELIATIATLWAMADGKTPITHQAIRDCGRVISRAQQAAKSTRVRPDNLLLGRLARIEEIIRGNGPLDKAWNDSYWAQFLGPKKEDPGP